MNTEEEKFYEELEDKVLDRYLEVVRDPELLMDLIDNMDERTKRNFGGFLSLAIRTRPVIREYKGKSYIGLENGEPNESSWLGKVAKMIKMEIRISLELDNERELESGFNQMAAIEKRGVTGYANL